uniref:Uncharacterized protein n=1 Tax=Anopheles culicifacies TaxID=139723 RepID=A0A182MD07_9DIPT
MRYKTIPVSIDCGINLCPITNDAATATAVMPHSVRNFCFTFSATSILEMVVGRLRHGSAMRWSSRCRRCGWKTFVDQPNERKVHRTCLIGGLLYVAERLVFHNPPMPPERKRWTIIFHLREDHLYYALVDFVTVPYQTGPTFGISFLPRPADNDYRAKAIVHYLSSG